jgi:hypothetical protein
MLPPVEKFNRWLDVAEHCHGAKLSSRADLLVAFQEIKGLALKQFEE